MLKSYGWWGGVGGLCDYCVSLSPFGVDFGTLDFGTSDSGLTIRLIQQEEIFASKSNQIMCEKTKQHQLISEDRRLTCSYTQRWESCFPERKTLILVLFSTFIWLRKELQE